MIDYEDKVVLVTGAASGIGEALASALGARGAQLICADIDADGLNNVVEKMGGTAQALVCDLSDPAAAAKLIDDAYAIAGRLDLVCSNAGIGFADKLSQDRL